MNEKEILRTALSEFIETRTAVSVEWYAKGRWKGHEPWWIESKIEEVNQDVLTAQEMLRETFK
jgi:hypothetical protein